MVKHDLTSALEPTFTFGINDKEFSFRKPTVREMRAIAKVFAGIDAEKDPEVQIEKSDAAMAELYRFVEPINHDTPLEELLQDQPVEVQNRFNIMIKDELGASN